MMRDRRGWSSKTDEDAWPLTIFCRTGNLCAGPAMIRRLSTTCLPDRNGTERRASTISISVSTIRLSAASTKSTQRNNFSVPTFTPEIRRWPSSIPDGQFALMTYLLALSFSFIGAHRSSGRRRKLRS